MINPIPKSILLGTCIAIITGTCYALIPDILAPETNDPIAEITLPPANTITSKVAVKPDFTVVEHLIQPGESLSVIFSNLGIDKLDLHNIVNSDDFLGKQFATITPGKTLRFESTKDGELQQLSYPKNLIETLVAKRYGENFQVEQLAKDVNYRTVSAQTHIQSSLFLDAKKNGLSDKLIMDLTNIFAWEVDFALNIRVGDQFTVVYEEILVGDKVIGAGDVLAAEFINKGHIYQAVRYQDKKGNNHYYTPEGKSLKKAFLSTPIEFARISSYFNLRRKHPVLNRIRAHKGVDYAAKTGTRIKTTGNGVITYRGRKGGYGRVVIVQHGKRYSTLYAHLSKFRKGQRVGSRVSQGDTIGYVGQSGLATGPHLHYEFLVNGIHRNPLTVSMPKNPPITGAKLAAFKQQTQRLLVQLELAKITLVVENELQSLGGQTNSKNF